MTVTSSATANTKGAWAQLDASTSFDASMLLLHISTRFIDTRYLLDIGIGAAGNEQVFVPNLMIGLTTGIIATILLPLAIPAGSRIAARSQDSFGGSDSYISGTLFAGGWLNPPPFANVTAYGASTAASGGTTVDAGATANTKGAWTQLTASTTSTHKGLLIAAMRPDPAVAMNANEYAQLADIGVGAAGSEQVLIPNLQFRASVQSGGATGSPLALTGRGLLSPMFVLPVPCDIPAGSRLAVRQQSSSTNATDRTCAYVIYGLG